MRLYVYEPGPPAHVSAEFVMPDETWRELTHRGLSGRGETGVSNMSEHGRLVPRDQVPAEVLAAWESCDDSAFLQTAPVYGWCRSDLGPCSAADLFSTTRIHSSRSSRR
jgi:hypothetical protein